MTADPQLGVKDFQTVSADGKLIRELIEGVILRESPNIVTRNGLTSEVFSSTWNLTERPPQHMIYATLRPRVISAWHLHKVHKDCIFVTEGTLKVVLYDGREVSKSHRQVNVFLMSRYRPSMLVVPTGVWHGIQNLDQTSSSFINVFDYPYCHEDPDEWRLPVDTDEIPFQF